MTTSTPPSAPALPAHPALFRRQLLAVLRLELSKTLFSRRALIPAFVALIPLGLGALLFVLSLLTNEVGGNDGHFGEFYFHFVLMLITFFGTALISMNLFRGELLDRCLHYYLLCPLRRPVLVLGKFLAGLLASCLLYGASAAGSYWLLSTAFAQAGNAAAAPQLLHALAYVGTTILGCLGYGAVFLLIGLYFRNPLIPVIFVWGWESINFLLPPLLKKISVVHYLRSLSPVPISEGPFAIVADPVSAWISVPGLLLVAAAALALASARVSRLEISYGDD